MKRKALAVLSERFDNNNYMYDPSSADVVGERFTHAPSKDNGLR